MCSDHLRCPGRPIPPLAQVTCVYLFHELPAETRRKVAAEMARVLKPGGILVLTDSVQYGDRPVWDKMLGMFSKFNEPYYMSYISEDLGAVLINRSPHSCNFAVAASSGGCSMQCKYVCPAPQCNVPGPENAVKPSLCCISHILVHRLQEHCSRRWVWSLTTSWCHRHRRPSHSASSELGAPASGCGCSTAARNYDSGTSSTNATASVPCCHQHDSWRCSFIPVRVVNHWLACSLGAVVEFLCMFCTPWQTSRLIGFGSAVHKL